MLAQINKVLHTCFYTNKKFKDCKGHIHGDAWMNTWTINMYRIKCSYIIDSYVPTVQIKIAIFLSTSTSQPGIAQITEKSEDLKLTP